MLKVPCGVSGKVRVVKENSLTGEITHDSEFDNIWTDAGLAYISGNAFTTKIYPIRLGYGSGERAEPHSGVVSLANRVGVSNIEFSSRSDNDTITELESSRVVTKRRSITVGARGIEWSLSELALMHHNGETTLTYALVRNLAGDPEPVIVSDIEILTIYYTVQISYPREASGSVVVEGLPATTANFSLIAFSKTNTVWEFDRLYIGGTLNRTSGLLGISEANGINITISSWSNNKDPSGSVTFDPPIVKNNTQTLQLEWGIEFTNATPIEIPQ